MVRDTSGGHILNCGASVMRDVALRCAQALEVLRLACALNFGGTMNSEEKIKEFHCEVAKLAVEHEISRYAIYTECQGSSQIGFQNSSPALLIGAGAVLDKVGKDMIPSLRIEKINSPQVN